MFLAVYRGEKMTLFSLIVFLACRDTSTVKTDPSEEGDIIQDNDGDGFFADEDCNDSDASVHPDAIEICDGMDNNCDGQADEGVEEIFYVDSDGDGFGNASITTQACELPAGYSNNGSDCDDTTEDIYPSAEEVCDGLDNDCDGVIDNDLLRSFFVDADGDGFGNSEQTIQACSPDFGIVQLDGDCDDSDPSISPIANELCDDVDNNCDGQVDEGLLISYYFDFDEDGYGDPDQKVESCQSLAGYVTNMEDCDDLESFANPGMVEVCDGLDNDCDGVIDDALSLDALAYYPDSDGDGFGANVAEQYACTLPSGASLISGDCDDTSVLVNPAMIEICDTFDNNCDGQTDESTAYDAAVWYSDGDGDGYGVVTDTILSCEAPAQYTSLSGDCNDADDLISPGADEVCDSFDNNCDGQIDESTAVDASVWYADTDEDGYGDPDESLNACVLPSGYVEDNTDCDDDDEALLSVSLDEDCNGVLNEDEPCVPGNTAAVFAYTGADQSFTVPSDVECITVKLWGGGGSGGGTDCGYPSAGFGGPGAFVSGILDVTEGEVFVVRVGGGGTFPGNNDGYYAGHGGGRSELAQDGDPIAIAGAGGAGPARECSLTLTHAGPGGCEIAEHGSSSTSHFGFGGTGGTQSDGGNFGGGYLQGGGGTSTYPNGGTGAYCTCGGSGGGGDGYYGGGQGIGGYAAGGGGSSLIPEDFECEAGSIGDTTPPGVSDSDWNGAGAGGAPASSGTAGQVIIYY